MKNNICIEQEAMAHQLGAYRVSQIQQCSTRSEIAAILLDAGYQISVIPGAVSVKAFGRQVATITSSTLPDFK